MAAGKGGRLFGDRVGRGRPGIGGQIDLEGSRRVPTSLYTVMNPPWLFTMPSDGGQAEPGALADSLRGEERLEYPVPDLRRNAVPVSSILAIT